MDRRFRFLLVVASFAISGMPFLLADTETKPIGREKKVEAKLSGSEWWPCSDGPCFKDESHKSGLVTFLKIDGTPLPNNPDNIAPKEAAGAVCGNKNERRPSSCDPGHPDRKCVCALFQRDPNGTGEAKEVWKFFGSATDNMASGVQEKHEYRCFCITFTKPAGGGGSAGGTTKHPKRKRLVKD